MGMLSSNTCMGKLMYQGDVWVMIITFSYMKKISIQNHKYAKINVKFGLDRYDYDCNLNGLVLLMTNSNLIQIKKTLNSNSNSRHLP